MKVLLFEIEEKIKSLLPSEGVKKSDWSAVTPEGWVEPGGENREEGRF
jgi:hypothetical protein